MASTEFQCRTRLCWWCKIAQSALHENGLNVSMPHAALLVVQGTNTSSARYGECFNAARGFVGGARTSFIGIMINQSVSMPHAALLVVQGHIVYRIRTTR